MAHKKDNLITILTIVIVANLTALAWFAWGSYTSFRESQMVQERQLKAAELRGIITHLDEVLTMSARMAAATGDLRWESRYRDYEPTLGAAINKAIALSPQAYSGEAAAKTDSANILLVEMENRAFALVRQGNSDSAASILFGSVYEHQKRIYSDGMADFEAVITGDVISSVEEAGRAASMKTTIALLLISVLTFIWFVVFRTVRRWRNTLVQHNLRLAYQSDKLAALTENLDLKVSERVKELNCLYGLSRIIEIPDLSLENIFQRCLHLIPPGWKYPDITCARLLVGDQEYMSDNYQETEWTLSQDITVGGQVAGSIDVCYLEARPAADEGPFLKEERNLIRAIAENLQGVIERQRAEDLQHALFKISESVGQSSSFEGFLKTVHEILSTLIDTTNFYIALYDTESELYSFPYFVDQFVDPDFTPQELKRSLTDFVRRTGKPIMVSRQTLEMLIDTGEVEQVGQPSAIWLGVPLEVADITIGVVAVQSYNYAETYSEADLEVMSFASGHIALAIERKRSEENRKRMEKSLAQSEKMASIGQLAAGVAHEINNPISYVNSNLAAMNKYLRKIAEMTSPGVQLSCDQSKQWEEMLTDFGDAIEESLEGTERVKKIVSDLKGFSRPDAVEMTLSSIEECIESTVAIAWNQLKYHCQVNRDFGDLPEIECHPNQINQVILNLLINAGQATAEKKGLIDIKTWLSGNEIVISVRDNGCGIPPENLDRLFDPFFTTKDVGKGTGLGLSLSFGIIKEHSGRIEVESTVDIGTEFRVILPVTQVSNNAPEDQSVEEAEIHSIHPFVIPCLTIKA